MSKVYSLRTVQKLPVTLEAAWDYFSKPDNLADITPADMRFVITSKKPAPEMYAGQVIEYTLKPLLGIPMYWMTEITHVEHLKYFVDEQRYGPYALWHHQHHFVVIDGGVEMTDIVHYKIPFWFIGDIANTILVKKKLENIFAYRKVAVEKLFGKMS